MVTSPKRTVAEKLGIKANMQVVVINAPEDYQSIIGQLPDNVSITNQLNGLIYGY